MISIIDVGLGNIGSIQNMLRVIGAKSRFVRTADELAEAEKIILPGVGSFDVGISKIREAGLYNAIRHKALQDCVPLLGICLGMQILGNGSQEGKLDGLGIIDGTCVRFLKSEVNGNRIPHLRWNSVEAKNECVLFKGLNEINKFYFTHSFHFNCEKENDIAGLTNYGADFVSCISRDNIYGVQFHPEKSHKYGKLLLKNFWEL
ncbi:MAG: imidazole glycerol phosphate synthase subunit HisH [Rhodothermales bacterium]